MSTKDAFNQLKLLEGNFVYCFVSCLKIIKFFVCLSFTPAFFTKTTFLVLVNF